MTLAQVQAAVATVVALIGTWAGLMMAVALLLPQQTGRAEAALERSGKRCFGLGLLMLGLIVLSVTLSALPFPLLKLTGLAGLLALSGVLTLGATGMAFLMGRRIGDMSGARTSFGFLVRGSFVYSAALFFPYVGWFVFAPLSLLCALGAGASALWPLPRPVAYPPQPIPAPGWTGTGNRMP